MHQVSDLAKITQAVSRKTGWILHLPASWRPFPKQDSSDRSAFSLHPHLPEPSSCPTSLPTLCHPLSPLVAQLVAQLAGFGPSHPPLTCTILSMPFACSGKLRYRLCHHSGVFMASWWGGRGGGRL